MEEKESILQEYGRTLSMQSFVEEDLDYGVLERHLPFLKQLDEIGNSSVTVFDLFRREHVFISSRFGTMLGYDVEQAHSEGNAFFDAKVHPEDFLPLTRHGIEMLKFCFSIPADERKEYKLINDYRIRNGREEYVRVLEQHQALELDRYGNLWLVLSIIDISPDQDPHAGIKSRLFNFKKGEVYHFPVPMEEQGSEREEGENEVRLSSREQEILRLVRKGLISKEIADRLYISVHTVNTHRQRILEKLNVNNSHEAVRYASSLGLL